MGKEVVEEVQHSYIVDKDTAQVVEQESSPFWEDHTA